MLRAAPAARAIECGLNDVGYLAVSMIPQLAPYLPSALFAASCVLTTVAHTRSKSLPCILLLVTSMTCVNSATADEISKPIYDCSCLKADGLKIRRA